MTRTEREKPPPPQGRDEVAARATEGMLGPNPFVGLRSQDVMEQFWTIAETSAMHPQLVLAQQAELAREFIAILSGNSELVPNTDDKRFRDADWSCHSRKFRPARSRTMRQKISASSGAMLAILHLLGTFVATVQVAAPA